MRRTYITSVVAHIDHGKTTLIDSLIASQGMISKHSAGNLRYMDTRRDEQERGITLKLSAIKINNNEDDHIIIDTPGHVDFESLVQVSSCIADNFLVIIDINEGVTPRLFSIINHIKNKRAILVLNKIDKKLKESNPNEFFTVIQGIICRLNGLIGSEYFGWTENNVIMAWSTMCMGINFNHFSKLIPKKISPESSLKLAIKFIFALRDKIAKNEVKAIYEKYKIKSKNEKGIWSGVLPLSDVIFESITCCNTKICPFIGKENKKNQIDHELKAVAGFSILKNSKLLHEDNMYFVVRIFEGSINVNDIVFSRNNDGNVRECRIEEIYEFGINSFEKVQSVEGSTLVLVKSNFYKHSLVTKDLNESKPLISLTRQPFFKRKLVLKDPSEIDRFKECLRTLSFLETIIRVKKNCFDEFEIFCEGRVQLEKISHDLQDNNFEFDIVEMDRKFSETVKHKNELFLKIDDMEVKISTEKNNLEKYENQNDNITEYKRKSNNLIIKSDQHENLIKSAFEVFISNGPLIKEELSFVKVDIDLKTEKVDDTDKIFSFLKDGMTKCYIGSSPTIIPHYFLVRIQILPEYHGKVYNVLHLYHFIIKDEIYDESKDFFIIECLIPQFIYYNFVDDIRMKTKGTVYLEVEDYGLDPTNGFEWLIDEVKKEKGMFVEEMIIKEPQKQRTLKK